MSHEAFLRTALTKYKYFDATKNELLKIMKSFNDLRPASKNFVFNDGVSKDLVCLEGTIPVSYKGKMYNIPICIYLMETHPYNPPMIYVKPTQSMQIRQGKHVDANGRVYLPYLHEWKYPQSDLSGLIQMMSMVFGEEPPVFSKPTVLPANNQSSRLPYPIGNNMPMPSYATGNNQPAQFVPSSNLPYPTYTQPPYPQPPFAAQPLHSNHSVGANISHQAATSSFNNVLSEEERKLSLLSAVEDKMKKRLKEILAQGQAEMETLKTTQEDLEKGRKKLEGIFNKIEQEQMKLESDVRTMQSKATEISQVLSRMKLSEDVLIDDIIVPVAPLYKQILAAFAEEQSIDDAIYYLGEALRRNVIELDVFLKQVRELSRKQFLLRMTINKCRQKAGFVEVY
ncbi:hypothetical protein HELRODRAFT_185660 [Helobdella robusta]|uniref:UEV domain-containing protein n=1 Tax=Helobdella robusta TaxID=6412 RepID=T1FN37_HELRO|nr:hypothetical protein HELRODRAFT_185660 [Helobdella robusta]ESO02994.1 hypothetical protein HELRODRAFT_185660 [Helobdella robusta]